MKHLNKIIVFILAFAFISCDEFLDINYDSQVREDDFNKNKEELYVSLMGCYNGLQSSIHREWAMTELRSDNSRINKTNTSASPYNEILGLDLAGIQTNNLFIQEFWDASYNNIKNCNLVIRDVDVVTDETLRNEYLAEAMFIRANHYFSLVRLFGGVPLVLKRLSVNEANTMGRNTVDEIYNQVQTDLETIVNNDMLTAERKESELGRVTALAAKSLLAKVYMTRYAVGSADYLKAKPLLEDVIDVVGTSELTPYEDIFAADSEMSEEIIFAVRYKTGNIGIGSPFGNEFAPIQSGTSVVNGDGRAFNVPTSDLIAAYGAGDLRKNINLAVNYVNTTTNNVVDDPYVKKYLTESQVAYDGERDWSVIRLADVILLYAEILNEEGDVTKAAEYTDMIRKRANLAVLDDEAKANKGTMRNAIRAERRLELAFENQRWYDLMRWGIAREIVNAHFKSEGAGEFYSVEEPSMDIYRTILPIPYTVINVNPGMSQNAGY